MTPCWLYLGSLTSNGYGKASVAGRTALAHRAAYEALVGPIPPGLQLDHLCRNRACYNPAHLEPVTQRENLRRGRNSNAEKTHCPLGHEYSDENTYVCARGKRSCKTCNRARNRVRYHVRKGLT